jgi:hypothetical protein
VATSFIITNDAPKAFRYLKNKGILSDRVAEALAVTIGWVSKLKNGHEPWTLENIKAFNESFGHIVKLDEAIANLPQRDQIPMKDQSLSDGEREVLVALLQKAQLHRDVLSRSEEGRKALELMRKLSEGSIESGKGK